MKRTGRTRKTILKTRKVEILDADYRLFKILQKVYKEKSFPMMVNDALWCATQEFYRRDLYEWFDEHPEEDMRSRNKGRLFQLSRGRYAVVERGSDKIQCHGTARECAAALGLGTAEFSGIVRAAKRRKSAKYLFFDEEWNDQLDFKKGTLKGMQKM